MKLLERAGTQKGSSKLWAPGYSWLHRLWVTAEVYDPLYNASRPRGQAA